MATSIQQNLTAILRTLPKTQAKEYARQIAELHKAGFTQLNVFPKGIPHPDTVEISAIVQRKDLARLLPQLIDRLPGHGRLEVFPYGIPAIDLLRVEFR
jgi:hypothetical protein